MFVLVEVYTYRRVWLLQQFIGNKTDLITETWTILKCKFCFYYFVSKDVLICFVKAISA